MKSQSLELKNPSKIIYCDYGEKRCRAKFVSLNMHQCKTCIRTATTVTKET